MKKTVILGLIDARNPFVEVHGATIRGDAPLSALFGHTMGAFTGALAPRHGLLRAADGAIPFSASRQSKKTPNDADRLRKYLARFGLSWHDLKPSA